MDASNGTWAIEEAISFFAEASPLHRDATAQLAQLRAALQQAREALLRGRRPPEKLDELMSCFYAE